MKCEEFMSLLPLYPDAMASTQTASDFRIHAAECPECAARLEEHEILLSTLKSMDDGMAVPEAFGEGWRSAVRMESTKTRKSRLSRWQTWAMAAAAVCMVVCGTALMRGGMLFPSTGLDKQTVYMAGDVAGAPVPNPARSMTREETESDPQMMRKSMPVEEENGAGNTAQQQPIMLYSASVNLSSERYDDDIQQINELLKEIGGWSEYWSMTGEPIADNPDGGRFASMTLRVPMDSLQPFVDAVCAIGKATGSEMTAQDITDSYYDTQGRLAMYEAQRDRMTELLEQASSMSDIIDIEARLSELQYTIETLVGRLNNWNARVDNAVVYVSVVEVAPGLNQSADATIWQRIGMAFRQSLRAAKGFLGDMVIFLVMASPYIVCILAVAAIVIGSVWMRRKRQYKRSKAE